MPAGLQAFDANGVLVFDSTVNTVMSRLKVSVRTFTKVVGGSNRYETSIADLPNPSMRDYLFRITQANVSVSSMWVDEGSNKLTVALTYSNSATSLDMTIAVYRC